MTAVALYRVQCDGRWDDGCDISIVVEADNATEARRLAAVLNWGYHRLYNEHRNVTYVDVCPYCDRRRRHEAR